MGRLFIRNHPLRQSLILFIQCHTLSIEQLTTHRVRSLLINSPNYNLITLLQALYTTHALSNVPLDTITSLASYSPQFTLTKSYQYISITLLFNTIHDSLDTLKPTTIVQEYIYIYIYIYISVPPLYVPIPQST